MARVFHVSQVVGQSAEKMFLDFEELDKIMRPFFSLASFLPRYHRLSPPKYAGTIKGRSRYTLSKLSHI